LTVQKCRVINTNACNTVVEYDGVGKIQLPIPDVAGGCAYVKNENGRYSICSEKEYQDYIGNEEEVSILNEDALNISAEELELGIVNDKPKPKKKKKSEEA